MAAFLLYRLPPCCLPRTKPRRLADCLFRSSILSPLPHFPRFTWTVSTPGTGFVADGVACAFSDRVSTGLLAAPLLGALSVLPHAAFRRRFIRTSHVPIFRSPGIPILFRYIMLCKSSCHSVIIREKLFSRGTFLRAKLFEGNVFRSPSPRNTFRLPLVEYIISQTSHYINRTFGDIYIFYSF